MDAPAGGWIQTHSGTLFYPTAPRVEDICIEDLSHHLSLICRFCGAVREHYSVAQHSLHVSQVCESIEPGSALWGLLHDASEAYMSDVAGPIKRAPWMAGYRLHESELQTRIYERFGLAGPVPASVHVADRRMLVTEMRDLLPDPAWWSCLGGKPMSFAVTPWPIAAVKDLFLARFHKLMTDPARRDGQ